MDRKLHIIELQAGDRFFHAGMWHDFVSANTVGDSFYVYATNGYSSDEYLLVIYQEYVTIH